MNVELDRSFLKRLWNNERVLCLKCNDDYLVPLHKKRHDNNDFICPKCKEIYRTIDILQDLLKSNENKIK